MASYTRLLCRDGLKINNPIIIINKSKTFITNGIGTNIHRLIEGGPTTLCPYGNNKINDNYDHPPALCIKNNDHVIQDGINQRRITI